MTHLIERSRRSVSSAVVLAATALAAGLFAYQFDGSREVESRILTAESRTTSSLAHLRAQHAALKRQLAAHSPTGAYIVVDTARNRLYVKRREAVLQSQLVVLQQLFLFERRGQLR